MVPLEGPDVVMPGSSANRTFELGETQITYIATDKAGNTSSCKWSVTVEDNEDPMISCIGDTTVYADANCVFIQLTDGFDPLISDNCPEINVPYMITYWHQIITHLPGQLLSWEQRQLPGH